MNEPRPRQLPRRFACQSGYAEDRNPKSPRTRHHEMIHRKGMLRIVHDQPRRAAGALDTPTKGTVQGNVPTAADRGERDDRKLP
jgi:hypothetical protein